MLVPRFSLEQTPNTVIVTIKLPYIRVGDAEVSAVGFPSGTGGLSFILTLAYGSHIVCCRMAVTLYFIAGPTS
jgi:hypothetical protein